MKRLWILLLILPTLVFAQIGSGFKGRGGSGGVSAATVSSMISDSLATYSASGDSIFDRSVVGTGTWTGDEKLQVRQSGVKTDHTYGAYINNDATDNANTKNKYGLRIESTGAWNNTGAVNYGLYLNATGGTTNYGLYSAAGTNYFVNPVYVGGTTSSDEPLAITQSGAKTADSYGATISNTGTSSTASVNKYGLVVQQTGTWNGSGAQQYCLYLNQALTTAYALYSVRGLHYFGGPVAINAAATGDEVLSATQSGVKTDNDYAEYITNTATNATINKNKYGSYISSTGTWTGTGAGFNYAQYIVATGGTTNYGVYSASSSAYNYFAGHTGIGYATIPYNTLAVSDINANSPGINLTNRTYNQKITSLATATDTSSIGFTLPLGVPNFMMKGATGNIVLNLVGGTGLGIGKAPSVMLDVSGAIAGSTTITAGTSITATNGDLNLSTAGKGIYFGSGGLGMIVGGTGSGKNLTYSAGYGATDAAGYHSMGTPYFSNLFRADTTGLLFGKIGGMSTATTHPGALVQIYNAKVTKKSLAICFPDDELITATADRDFSGAGNWTLGAGWSVTGGKLVHASGNTATAVLGTAYLDSTLVANKLYCVQFTVSGLTTQYATMTFGGTGLIRIAANNTYRFYMSSATYSSIITITPVSTFDGSFDNFSIKEVNEVLTIDSDGSLKSDGVITNNTISASSTVASGATITLGKFNTFLITGTAEIDSISTASTCPDGASVTLIFSGTAAATGVNDGGDSIKISGDFNYTPDDVLCLIRYGNAWYEKSRSAN